MRGPLPSSVSESRPESDNAPSSSSATTTVESSESEQLEESAACASSSKSLSSLSDSTSGSADGPVSSSSRSLVLRRVRRVRDWRARGYASEVPNRVLQEDCLPLFVPSSGAVVDFLDAVEDRAALPAEPIVVWSSYCGIRAESSETGYYYH